MTASEASAIREQLGWSQREMADVLGIAPDSLTRLENMETRPDRDKRRIQGLTFVMLELLRDVADHGGAEVLDELMTHQGDPTAIVQLLVLRANGVLA